jgi:serine/threonine-protein kinase
MANAPVRENEMVAGKYRVERTLGAGGMGVVVAAKHVELDQTVAIKFLLPEIAEHGASAERFRREARAAARIRSEHVCRVLDVGTLDGGVPYLVMEYLEGNDLGAELVARTRLPPPEAVDYVLQACEAVAEAHAAGIVHRDLKPENLFLGLRADGSRAIKVLDFGVSKSLGPSAEMKLTQTASLVGSPMYMAPEQLEAAADLDARADIWSLGVILFELLTGRTPFQAQTIPQLVNAVLHGEPATCAELGVVVPAGLEAAIAKALAKDRANRHASVAELAKALAPFGPPHAALSASRAARVLTKGEGTPPTEAVALGATLSSAPRNAVLTPARTLDVVRNTPHGLPEATADSWGNTRDRGIQRRRGLFAALVVVLVGAAAVLSVVSARHRVPPSDSERVAGTATPKTVPEPAAATPSASRAAAPTALPVVTPPEPAVPGSRFADEPVALAPSASASAKPRTSDPTNKPAKAGRIGSTAAVPSAARPEPKTNAAQEVISDFGGRR